MSVIFFDEYTRLKYDYAVTFSEPLQHPLLRCVLGIAIYACIVLWMVCALAQKADVAHARTCYRAVFNLAIGAGASQRCCLERCSSISFGSRVTWAM